MFRLKVIIYCETNVVVADINLEGGHSLIFHGIVIFSVQLCLVVLPILYISVHVHETIRVLDMVCGM